MLTTTAVYALTPQGAEIARRLAAEYGGLVCVPERMAKAGEHGFGTLRECVGEGYSRFARHIFVAAAGIVVRCIAPHLQHKSTDPAVVVLDQQGRFAISLVSGHLGGANALAQDVARITGGTAVITTATDTESLPSLDMVAMEAGCAIHNTPAIKHVNGALLAGQPVTVFDPEDRLSLQTGPHAHLFTFTDTMAEAACGGAAVLVTWRDPMCMALGEQTLTLHPKVLHLGIGCRKGRSADAIESFVRKELATRMIALESVADIASVDAKADEAGLLEAAQRLGVPIQFYAADALKGIKVPNPSAAPEKAVGTRSVAEAAAIVAAGTERGAGILIQEKLKDSGTTLAVAMEIA
ncbi:cobalamin biosynthesis protein [Desulfovibrio mangrovi]|uniref:cobalt-precorrin 5A hydrolase n=1 Tax=Desulfovibrio mangrovi TaxID=2976983 RepID=UPI002245D3B6|nr:cobalamin biosynthesis protein [Desulfovibrio mangrovi]UZP66221.1 cobalamin biosynthesis protein [Desulfovibrio mangrovi]